MMSFIRTKSFKWSASLLVALNLLFASALTALAADDLVFDNYDRTTLSDFAAGTVGAQWTGGDAGKGAAIDGNALKLEYASSGWFGSGGGIDASSYKYLKIRIKGAAGGEGKDFDLNYAVGDTVKTVGKAFADIASSAITKEYQDIYVDLPANKIDKGIQALHFNFHEGASGTLWIDSISFTNTAGAKATEPAKEPAKEPATDTSDTTATDDGAAASTAEPATNPKTGDGMNPSLYITLAAISGAAALTLVYRAKKANR
jgi:hypothetical protein